MHSQRGRILILLSLTLCLLLSTLAAAAEDWKIGVGGGRITGYFGLFARTGMPREYMTDSELADIDALRRYRVVIITEAGNPGPISRAVEQYVAEGGIAITEEQVAPSTAVVKGRRLGPAVSPNLTFAKHDHPISRAMRSAGVSNNYARPAIAIIPDTADNVTVLADYTEENVTDRYRGTLTAGRSGIPAVLHIRPGQG